MDLPFPEFLVFEPLTRTFSLQTNENYNAGVYEVRIVVSEDLWGVENRDEILTF